MIPYGRQYIDDIDIEEVVKVLRSDFLTQGLKVEEFEKKIAQYCGAKYAVAVSSGTAALHLACLATGIKYGDEVITTPMTFAASANCILYAGGHPVFVDINEKNGLIDENLIEEKITTKTKAIIPVHYSGHPCNMEKIREIAQKYNLNVIEDACHALGSEYKNSKIGDCIFSDMTVFSFHPVKHITTGEGGIITTNSEKKYHDLLLLRSHGITKNPDDFINKNEGTWFHEMQNLGYNYRITDFQCALGISQLSKIEQFITRRIEIVKKYDNAFIKNENIELLRQEHDIKNSYHLYVIKLKNELVRLQLFDYLKEHNIYCQVHYIPVYLHPYYQKLGYRRGGCPKSEEFYRQIISIPIYPGLTDSEQDKIIHLIYEYFG